MDIIIMCVEYYVYIYYIYFNIPCFVYTSNCKLFYSSATRKLFACW